MDEILNNFLQGSRHLMGDLLAGCNFSIVFINSATTGLIIAALAAYIPIETKSGVID